MRQTADERAYRSALRRGAGRCVTMLSSESARRKYRLLVMWACGRDLGYDTQVEGTRALFLYDLIGQYANPEPFLDGIERKLFAVEKKFFSPANKAELESLFMQESDLLVLFATDSDNVRARRILERGYERFLRMLLNLAWLSKTDMLVLDSFDYLCGRLLLCARPKETQPMLERIVRDLGRLYMRDSGLNSCVADYFRCEAENMLGEKRYAAMLGRIDHSPEVEAYKAAVFLAKKESEARDVKRKRRQNLGYKAVYRRVSEQGTFGIRYMVRRWRLDGRTKDIEGLVRLYVLEKDTETRAMLLDMFSAPDSRCEGYLPLDCVLRDASSDNDTLGRSAAGVLKGVKSRRVHDYALDMVKRRGVSHEMIAVLAGNYREDDDDLLIAALKKLGEKQHDVYTILARVTGGKGVDRLSTRMLAYLYETIRCTHCRNRVVRELGRRGLLTDDMLAECLHDASVDIREYARRILKRRRAKSA